MSGLRQVSNVPDIHVYVFMYKKNQTCVKMYYNILFSYVCDHPGLNFCLVITVPSGEKVNLRQHR